MMQLWNSLTPTQQNTMRLVKEGFDNRTIAAHMNTTVNVVRLTMSRIYERLKIDGDGMRVSARVLAVVLLMEERQKITL
jgi:DNA-binding NarL/FixJ family response regulator